MLLFKDPIFLLVFVSLIVLFVAGRLLTGSNNGSYLTTGSTGCWWGSNVYKGLDGLALVVFIVILLPLQTPQIHWPIIVLHCILTKGVMIL